jgi:dTDP-4-amino-4,6-dideoxygalactose transaminase
MSEPEHVPVCRPELPSAEAIATYIRQIDACRQYTNRGPLVIELEARLARALERAPHAVLASATGTAALEVAILATAGLARPERPLALLPAFTFAATALAVERCGYAPWFVDIDPGTWMLDPGALARHPMIGRAGLIVPVAPYGMAPDMTAWEELMSRTGLQVVVDAAAAFEAVMDAPALISASVPMMLSFHATKTFSTGEGGAILWDNPAGQERATQVANFGFLRSRECRVAGTNAKLSEYHAAVGLAMWDDFTARRAAYARVSGAYAQGVAENRGGPLGGRLHLPPRISSAYALFEADSPAQFSASETALHAALIETRRWYETGLHTQPHFAGAGADPLPVTEDLGGRLIGLPMSHDLSGADIALILTTLQGAVLPARAHA